MNKNDRAGYRFLAGLKAILTLEGEEFVCQAIDLNRQGAMVEGVFPPRESPEASISLQSVTDDQQFVGTGRVAYRSPDSTSGNVKIGLQFGALEDDQRANLELLLARVIEGMNPASLAHLTRDSTIEEIRKALKKIPLAHRVMLARRAQVLERGFLKHDENNQVLETLCRNPQLTLPEIQHLLRLNTLLPTTLEAISRDPRWSTNEQLKITIATHPRVTFPTADRIVRSLSIVGIRKVIRTSGLNPAIKARLVQTIPHKQLQGW